VAGGGVAGGRLDRAGPAAGVADPPQVHADGQPLVLDVGARRGHGRVGAQLPQGRAHRRAHLLGLGGDHHPAIDDLLKPVQAQVADPGGGDTAGQPGGRAAGHQGDRGEAAGQPAEQLGGARQRDGGLGVVDDRRQGAVEVQAQRRPARLPGDLVDGQPGHQTPG
jgi:hypothetical protein